ncbi:hypothetical protein KC332_g4312 [Hortaea werneckii]|uniref:Arrestin C-terminal-like domain-containing protein n=1 Tax=Hortaea werneckii TaxID=91943 RepID=A0A3M7IKQ1_HORWE|nr:hypothetical protein KC358_g5996 [Hortaea werneckii]KAI6840538.1 hypothetical protein KC350_g5421 [Hortaea werneckii]KAI6933466.1 hypothetical protein KC348_g6728 [Hortaea werneckii]KAI6940508.1 hypothetical protein KC341_g3472 [Hortaea werneckii]KAI6977258.1 hypothetical protein KC321_g3553 [Hortaea werneckii]
MAGRLRGYEISRPKPIEESKPQRAPQINPYRALSSSIDGPAIPSTIGSTRPLSDIREITEPSLIDVAARYSRGNNRRRRSVSRDGSSHRDLLLRHERSPRHRSSPKRHEQGTVLGQGYHHPHVVAGNTVERSSSSYSSPADGSTPFNVPQTSIPYRSSSFGHTRHSSKGHARKHSIRAAPTPGLTLTDTLAIPNHGRSQSPVKQADLRQDPISSDAARRVPSRTLLRNPHPYDILEYPSYKHPRFKLELQATAPVFVGGGSVEGTVKVTVDNNERLKQRRSLGIGAISVDLVGYEEATGGGRRAIFLSLVTELLDAKHPPPANMSQPVNPLVPGDRFWTLMPSTSTLPFMVSLPLDTGPPPFRSKHACIQFTLSVTALVCDAGKLYRVRTSQSVDVLPTYDPEKALTSLPSPLTASDELLLPRAGGMECIKVTAGLHRQVWVSSSTIFVDVHISNRSHKPVKRLDLSLERDILCYKHAAASTRERSAGQARIFESNHQSLIAMSSIRVGQSGWNGVAPNTSDTRTCDLKLPRGHATVRCGKYFEVRFFLNITASLSNTKLVSVQLPIILVHMNSLDVVPNSVAQVAAAIEERRAHHHARRKSESKTRAHQPTRQHSVSSPARAKDLRRKPSYKPGQAFAAPRQQSLDRERAKYADLRELEHSLDSSPRKHQTRLQALTLRKMGSTMSFGSLSGGVGGAKSSNGNESAFRAMAFRTPEPSDGGGLRAGPDSGAESVDSIRERMRRMASLGSSSHSTSAVATRWRANEVGSGGGGGAVGGGGAWQENVRPPARPEPPPVLGLLSATRPSLESLGGGASAADGRPATSHDFRDRLDRSRFEFKPVRQKPSVGASIRGKGVNLWEQVRLRGRGKERDREGWI